MCSTVLVDPGSGSVRISNLTCSVVEPELDFLAGAGAGEKAPAPAPQSSDNSFKI